MTRTKSVGLQVLSCVAALCWLGCQDGSPATQSTGAAPAAVQKPKNPDWKPAPPPPAGPIKCDLDPKQPGPMMRGGRARVQITGPGVAIDQSGVPAICGPLYNVNASSLGVKAGDGLLFRTCLPEGLVELSSDARVAGKQPVHAGRVPRGTDVIFAKHLGSSFSTAGVVSDEIVIADGLARAEANVELREIEGEGMLRAKVVYDCSVDEGAAAEPAAPPPSAASPQAVPAPAPTK